MKYWKNLNEKFIVIFIPLVILMNFSSFAQICKCPILDGLKAKSIKEVILGEGDIDVIIVQLEKSGTEVLSIISGEIIEIDYDKKVIKIENDSLRVMYWEVDVNGKLNVGQFVNECEKIGVTNSSFDYLRVDYFLKVKDEILKERLYNLCSRLWGKNEKEN